ncbi:MAG: gliding motility-associated C-terminal domain-containing protein [Chitinophagales bacterium]|nr:gliding motility-associated C-terminal domain-containing protein [Chitinophagales bacterium]MDW8273657.1 gliding motility-associated C-terminal domain-containing protein [Chitinophagales bacterium]
MLRKAIVFLSLVFPVLLSAQALFYNNGANMYVKNGGFMIVKTNSVQNASGLIANEGTVVVEGYVRNDATINGSGDTIRLTGDWINNGTYSGNGSWVEMVGGAQLLTGSQPTIFNNLALLGGNVVKTQTIDQEVTGILRLNDAELATEDYRMYVSNPNPNAIFRNNGFVSSLGYGNLSRATNTTAAYLFPTGSPSSLGSSLYRPIEIRPSAASTHIFGVRTIKGDATAAGFNVNQFDDSLCKVNPNFYHHIQRLAGSNPAAVTMFYDPANDGVWNAQANWRINQLWNYTGTSTQGNVQGFATVVVGYSFPDTHAQHALAAKRFTIDAGPTLELVEGETGQLNPVVTGINSPSYNWLPPTFLSCTDCPTPDVTPAEAIVYTLIVTDASGCSASDTVSVRVLPDDLFMPTGFSPNGDGVNDVFRPLNKNLKKFKLQIYNRWGELIFETDNPKIGWDGIYKTHEQGIGVYAWTAEYQTFNMKKSKFVSGNVTLVR